MQNHGPPFHTQKCVSGRHFPPQNICLCTKLWNAPPPPPRRPCFNYGRKIFSGPLALSPCWFRWVWGENKILRRVKKRGQLEAQITKKYILTYTPLFWGEAFRRTERSFVETPSPPNTQFQKRSAQECVFTILVYNRLFLSCSPSFLTFFASNSHLLKKPLLRELKGKSLKSQNKAGRGVFKARNTKTAKLKF